LWRIAKNGLPIIPRRKKLSAIGERQTRHDGSRFYMPAPTKSALNSARDLPLLLTQQQAAGLIGCGTRTLRRWGQTGVAPKPRIIGGDGSNRRHNALTRYSRDEILEWIAAGCPAELMRAGRLPKHGNAR